jgi:hypothetical protein
MFGMDLTLRNLEKQGKDVSNTESGLSSFLWGSVPAARRSANGLARRC